MIKIETGIPIPTNNIGRPAIYPLAELAVGQSFFVEGGDVVKLRQAAKQHGRRYGKKFTTAKVADGARCWRIE